MSDETPTPDTPAELAGVEAETSPGVTPAFSVVSEDVSDEEVAALAVVFAAMSGGGEEEPSGPRPQWGVPTRSVRHSPGAAPGGWMLSRLPG